MVPDMSIKVATPDTPRMNQGMVRPARKYSPTPLDARFVK